MQTATIIELTPRFVQTHPKLEMTSSTAEHPKESSNVQKGSNDPLDQKEQRIDVEEGKRG